MLSYLTFALSFFVRPLGGLIFGHIGGRIGRKKTLNLTLMMMGIATMLIGFLPDYHTIGIWAPIWLILLRLIQGLGIGGEWGGAVLLAVEYAPKGRRGFFCSVPQMGVPIGLLLGTFSMSVASALTGDAFLSWGWRIPFLLSAVLVFVGLWIRTGLDETPVFKETKNAGAVAKIPVIETFRSHWKSVLVAVGAKVVETAPFYIFSTFVIGYATQHLGFDRTTALNAVSLATLGDDIGHSVYGRAGGSVWPQTAVHRRHGCADGVCLPVFPPVEHKIASHAHPGDGDRARHLLGPGNRRAWHAFL